MSQSAREFKGKPFLRETRTMMEEPHQMLRRTASGNVMALDPGVVVRRNLRTASDGYLEDRKDWDAGHARRWTQTDQDETDAATKRRIIKDLVNSWMDRLQLISVITTFFAATEAQLLGFAVPDEGVTTRIQEAATAILAGALVVHLFAAILSFLAAFFLVRYRIEEAKHEEDVIESSHAPPCVADPEADAKAHQRSDSRSSSVHIWSTNPHLEQVGPFRRGKPPTALLEHCHSLCMWLATVGFVLALAGVLCYTWSRLPHSASIFASACMGVCIVLGICAVCVQF
ncbi:uncharacterized protein FIBRA_07420 [Fibroporia radiculosa]|uniref:Transmembrane protein n=1 Tax=Fibroporia radiculosa TaxID=599839 RepID=J4GUY3_9APHY|nr:uncharacterized protein FIBRA_07420 [Fibroporia radiculosa]CCM05210.1 predicted protein [Fibroporia radiculosa]